MEDFNIRLKKALMLRDMSQAELCSLTDIPKSAMSQYLSGSFKPKQSRTYSLAKALNISPVWLMGYDVPIDLNNISSGDASLPSILEKYNSLNKTGQQKTDEYIDDLLENPKYTKSDTAPAYEKDDDFSLADLGNLVAEGGEGPFHRPKKKKPYTTL